MREVKHEYRGLSEVLVLQRFNTIIGDDANDCNNDRPHMSIISLIGLFYTAPVNLAVVSYK